jgi:hypothetical protein
MKSVLSENERLGPIDLSKHLEAGANRPLKTSLALDIYNMTPVRPL